jgi:hypothetical protein
MVAPELQVLEEKSISLLVGLMAAMEEKAAI